MWIIRQKCWRLHANHPDDGILYLQQDMREFELYGTVKAVVCVCDSMNYLLEEEDLAEVFSLVHNYLDQDGIFIFDMNTLYKYRDLIGDATICENREHESFIWENCFDEESSINEYALTLFVEQENGLYARYEEFHYQRAYELKKVEERGPGIRSGIAAVAEKVQKSRQKQIVSGHISWQRDHSRIYFKPQFTHHIHSR